MTVRAWFRTERARMWTDRSFPAGEIDTVAALITRLTTPREDTQDRIKVETAAAGTLHRAIRILQASQWREAYHARLLRHRLN